MSAPEPFDMNKMMAVAINNELEQRAPTIVAQTLLTAGNSLRAQAFGMTANLKPTDFCAQPAKMSDGGCIVLLRSLKYVGGTYRLVVGPAYGGDDGKQVLGRSIIILDEVESDLIQTKFVKLSVELEKELARQLDVIQLTADGSIELCLAVIPQPIEGYEYFVDQNAASTDTSANTSAAAAAENTSAGDLPVDTTNTAAAPAETATSTAGTEAATQPL